MPKDPPAFNPAFTTAAGVVKYPDASRRWALASTKTFKEGTHAKCFFVGRAPPRVGAAAVLQTGPEYTSKGSYSGNWSGNLRNGVGTQMYADGSRYEGCWALGKREGQGSLYVRRGAGLMLDYTGSWEGGRKQGFGKQSYANGDVYEGAFVNGARHGQGMQVFADGAVYRGEWCDDKRHGMGELVLPSGDMYRGAWDADEKHGEGSYVFVAKGRVLHGEWVRGSAATGELRSHEG